MLIKVCIILIVTMKNLHITVEPYTEDELKRIEHCIMNSKQYACNTAGEFLRFRDLTIFKLGAIAGFRGSEMFYLKWSDLDFEHGLAYLTPFSNKERNAEPVVLNAGAVQILKGWKEIFDTYLHCAYCFPSLFTFEPITSCAYRKRLLEISKEAGVGRIIWYTDQGQPVYNKRLNSTRKYFATRIYAASKDPYLTMRALRQSSIRSVTQYTFISNEDIKKEEDKIFL